MKQHLVLLVSFAQIVFSVSIISIYKHDVSCYTQGLEFSSESTLLQSCGHYGHSRIRQLTYNQMTSQYEYCPDSKLPNHVFGEGLTVFKGKIYVLTWRQNKVYVFDDKLQSLKDLDWNREGWGIAHNQTHMIISDGSSRLYVVNEDLEVLQVIEVTHKGRPLRFLNQLQYYEGSLLANIYVESSVALINLQTGVAQMIDFRSVVQKQKKLNKKAQVLNGIAYDQENSRLLVTGKNWEYMYEVTI